MDKCDILGVKISRVTMEEAVSNAGGFFGGGVHTVYTPNPEIIMLAQKDEEYKKILNDADMLLADGIGVVIGSRIIKNPLPERVAGFDFVCRMLEGGYSFYLLGAKPDVVQLAAEKLINKGVNVVGLHHGYFEDDTEVIKDINEKEPDILLVCLGAPKQEKWIAKNKDKLKVSLCIAAGGTLDVLSGKVIRAPLFIRRIGLEWLYRALSDPSRIARLGAIPGFLFKVIRSV
jgi:N-acetylglucosaminyldiphosphoundecaprenol N-acetyl-beta-D-mannosaminyltransferase